MGEIYLRDDFLQERRQVRYKRDIEQILESLVSPPHSFIKPVPKGFIVGFPHDRDINYMIHRKTISLLKLKNLTVDLSKNTRADREIMILDTPDYIFNEQDAYILNNLEMKNGIKIIQFCKYTSPYSGK